MLISRVARRVDIYLNRRMYRKYAIVLDNLWDLAMNVVRAMSTVATNKQIDARCLDMVLEILETSYIVVPPYVAERR